MIFRPVEPVPLIVELASPLHAIGLVGVRSRWLSSDLDVGAVTPALLVCVPGQLVGNSTE